jgi:DNA-binding transcriptional LysR family regulator
MHRGAPLEWNHLQTLLAVADRGSFSAAAKRLRITQPTVGRHIAALEQSLRVSLFERYGRGLRITSAGEALLEHARAMADAANRVERAAAGVQTGLEGVVRITASEVHATYLLPPLVVELRRRYPKIQLDIVASVDNKDLRTREADIALRSVRPDDSELIARKVREERAHLYVAPKLLRHHKLSLTKPLSEAQVAALPWLGFDREGTFLTRFGAALGVPLREERLILVSSNQQVQWACVREGLGVGVMIESVGDADPTVMRLPAVLPELVVSTWLVAHQEVRTNQRVRAVMDFLAATFPRAKASAPLVGTSSNQ